MHKPLANITVLLKYYIHIYIYILQKEEKKQSNKSNHILNYGPFQY